MTSKLSCGYGITPSWGNTIPSTKRLQAHMTVVTTYWRAIKSPQTFPSHVPYHNVVRRQRSTATSARDSPRHSPWSRGCGILWHIGKCCKPRLKAFISWQLTADIPPQMLRFSSHKSFIETSACHHLSYYSFQTMSWGHFLLPLRFFLKVEKDAHFGHQWQAGSTFLTAVMQMLGDGLRDWIWLHAVESEGLWWFPLD